LRRYNFGVPKVHEAMASEQEEVAPPDDLLHAERRLAELEAELRRLRGES
jgi:hypothetical protein